MHRYLRSKPGKKSLEFKDIAQGKTPLRALLRFAQHAGITSGRPYRFWKSSQCEIKEK
jgi:hypothetical protein